MSRAHWHILGPGSLGCLWAARLLQAGHGVTLLGRPGGPVGPDWLSLEASGRVDRYQVVRNTPDSRGAIQHLLVATKAHQTLEAIAPCLPALTGDADVLLLQNGMGVQQAATELLAGHPVFCGVSTEGAYLRGPLQVVHAGRGLTRIGALSAEHQVRLPALLAALANIDLALETEDNIQRRLWEKLAINCAINPLTALHRCRNGELAQGEALQQLRRVCSEISQVLLAEGLADIAEGLEARALHVVKLTAGNYSSMYQDVAAGRPTEIDYITGYLLQAAARHGIATPLNAELHARVKALL